MKKAVANTTTDTAVGGILSPEGHDPTLVIDPDFKNYGFWRGRSKAKRGKVLATHLDPGKVPRPKGALDNFYGTYVASAENEPLELFIPEELCKGFTVNQKPVNTLSLTEMGQELRTLAWSIQRIESSNQPNFEALRQARIRLGEIKEALDFKRQMQLSLENKVIGKAFGKKPELAAPGRQPALNAKQGVDPLTGKKKYAYAKPKKGQTPAQASIPLKKDEKPNKHHAATIAHHTGIPHEDLKKLAGSMSERKFVAHLRTHKLRELIAGGIHPNDLHSLHGELTRQA